MVLISAQRILMMPHPYIEPQLKVALRLLRYAYTRYLLLVFTKSVDSNFCAFWLAPVTRNILGYSLFWDGIQNDFSFRDSFEGRNFSCKWNSCTNKYQETDKIWLVGVYWSLQFFFLQQNHKKWSPSQLKCKQTLTKWRLLFTKSSFWFLSNWFGKD